MGCREAGGECRNGTQGWKEAWMKNEGWTHRWAAHKAGWVFQREKRGDLGIGGTRATCWKQWHLNRQRERVQRREKRKEWVHRLRKRTGRERRKPWSSHGWSWRDTIRPLQTHQVFAPRLRGWPATTTEALPGPGELLPRSPLIDN